MTLAAGQWTQLDDVLAGTGIAEGWVTVAVVSGSGPYFAYAVVNDGAAPGSATATDDGSYLPFASR